AGVCALNQPPSSRRIGTSRAAPPSPARSTSTMVLALGAQRRKRTRPSAPSSAPNGRVAAPAAFTRAPPRPAPAFARERGESAEPRGPIVGRQRHPAGPVPQLVAQLVQRLLDLEQPQQRQPRRERIHEARLAGRGLVSREERGARSGFPARERCFARAPRP